MFQTWPDPRLQYLKHQSIFSFVFWGHFPNLNFLEDMISEKKTYQSGGGPSGFWKLMSNPENNFRRPEVLISYFFHLKIYIS
jgi:hypothetical protein